MLFYRFFSPLLDSESVGCPERYPVEEDGEFWTKEIPLQSGAWWRCRVLTVSRKGRQANRTQERGRR